jgi:hypothetical protein
MKLSIAEIKLLLKSSYSTINNDIDKFIINRELSTDRVKVYTLLDSNDIIVVHRGSSNFLDWYDNLAYFQNHDLTNSSSYKIHLAQQIQILKKYPNNHIIVLGHSRGALYANQLYKDKLANQLITYNKPLNLSDIAKNLISKNKTDENSVNIRTSGDLPSVLTKLNQNDIVIPSKSINPIYEHNIDRFESIDQDLIIGTGLNNIFVKKIDWSKIRLKQIKNFVKLHKLKNVNITNLKKSELINIIDKFRLIK